MDETDRTDVHGLNPIRFIRLIRVPSASRRSLPFVFEQLFGLLEFLQVRLAEFRVAQVERLQFRDDHVGDRRAREPLVVGGDDVPGRQVVLVWLNASSKASM